MAKKIKEILQSNSPSIKNKTAVIGLSGGVDSAVAAILMQEAGWNLIAVHMLIHKRKQKEANEAKLIADELGIPFHLIDLIQEFNLKVASYLSEEYLNGRTPNPCIVCNREIKFGDLLIQAEAKVGKFDCFVTGHFARTLQLKNGLWTIEKGADSKKDQAYFLAMLTQSQIAKLHFPLFNLTKKEIREIAKSHKLKIAQKGESQDLCTGSYLQHLTTTSGTGDFIELSTGEILGKHKGIENYTIGQRRGLNIGIGYTLYVIKIDKEKNQIFVGNDKDLFSTEMKIKNINWVGIKNPPLPYHCEMKIRYRDKGKNATLIKIEKEGKNKIGIIKFKDPVRAITPGQLAVAYQNNTIAFSGYIV